MKRSTNKNFFSQFIYSRLFFVVVIACTILFGFGVARSYYQSYKIQQEISSLQEQVQGLNQKRLESLDVLSYVLSQNFVEEKAREEMNLMKEGEHVVVISPDSSAKESDHFVVNTPTRQSVSNPLKWWYYFAYHKLK